MEKVSTRISMAMSYKGMRQIDLANATGISKGQINHYIKDENVPKADKIFILSKALDVSEAWLMGYDVPMDRNPSSKKQAIEQLSKYTLSVALKFAQLDINKQQLVENLIDSLLNPQN